MSKITIELTQEEATALRKHLFSVRAAALAMFEILSGNAQPHLDVWESSPLGKLQQHLTVKAVVEQPQEPEYRRAFCDKPDKLGVLLAPGDFVLVSHEDGTTYGTGDDHKILARWHDKKGKWIKVNK